ncbi:MAG: hypothetical protein Q8N47_00240 [Bryobacterales bacterium]|nr:hypothetical protein [Bryobacterales bacterium]
MESIENKAAYESIAAPSIVRGDRHRRTDPADESFLFVIGSNWFAASQGKAAVRCLGHRGMLQHFDSNSRLAFRTIGERIENCRNLGLTPI